jgi:two-component system, cell cycle response regulator
MTATQEQRKPRLLAIDASAMIHRLLKARLRSERLEIHSASSASGGLDAARALLPEVILLDVDVPEAVDSDAFGVLEQLKADPLTHDIPVIVVSGSTDTKLKIRAFDMGAIDFVTKPFDIGELRARVRSAVRVRLLISMLAQRAQIDGLTGLWNRAHFDSRLHDEIASAQRHGTELALILCDLDNFKRLNDSFGHPFGDQVLEEFGRILTAGRSGDIACRYGGEEFAIIAPSTNAEKAAAIAERCRVDLRERRWVTSESLVVTASFGVTDLQRVAEASVAAMVQSADDALYSAKQQGKDRVVTAQPRRLILRATA